MPDSREINVQQMPGGYATGSAALQDLVQLSHLLSSAHDCRARLNAALGEIDRMITRTDAARKDALRAVERFADENPTSLGVSIPFSISTGIAEVEVRITAIERDVREVLDRAGDLP